MRTWNWTIGTRNRPKFFCDLSILSSLAYFAFLFFLALYDKLLILTRWVLLLVRTQVHPIHTLHQRPLSKMQIQSTLMVCSLYSSIPNTHSLPSSHAFATWTVVQATTSAFKFTTSISEYHVQTDLTQEQKLMVQGTSHFLEDPIPTAVLCLPWVL